ncbi:RxLR effector protein, partial [Phytophthora megakarya]
MERFYVLFAVVLATVLRCSASTPIQSNAVGIEFMSENHLSRTSNVVSRSLRSNEISSERTPGGNLKARLLQKNLNEWFAKHYSIGDVFDRLNLKYLWLQQNVFNEPKFPTWLKYADDVNTRDGNAAASMISILKSRFGTVRLTNMIQGGKTVGKSKHVAAKFEGLLIDDWKKFDYSADDVFQLLRLDNGLNGILSNPSWEVWLRYVDNLNLQNTPVLNILRVHYDDDNL